MKLQKIVNIGSALLIGLALPSLAFATLTIGANSITPDSSGLTIQGNVQLQDAVYNANTFLGITKAYSPSGSDQNSIGIASSVTVNNNNSAYGGNFISTVTGGSNSGAVISVGINVNGVNSGATSTILALEGASLVSSNSGVVVDQYGSFNQLINQKTISTSAKAIYAKLFNLGAGVATIPTASIGYFSAFNNNTITTLRGIDLSGWSNSGTVTTSYGIYMDTSIDVGSTKYAVYSSSTSDSYLQGNLGIGTASPSGKLDVNSDTIRVRTAKTPASAADTCNQGEIAWDSSFIYVCVATNTWKRSAIATW